MRKPWEEAGSHRDSFSDRPRRSDRRFDDRGEGRGQFTDREGFGSRGNFGDRNFSGRRRDRRDGDDRRSFSDRRSDRGFDRGFDRKGATGSVRRKPRFADQASVDFGVRSGPRARAAMNMRRPETVREPAASRNALITLDADVARVFGTSEAVNAALRHLIALAGLMGEAAVVEAKKANAEAAQVEDKDDEEVLTAKAPELEQAQTEDSVSDFEEEEENEDEEDEEWFELPPVKD